MANETIYGCVTWPGGVVTFDQDPGCQYTGCVDWSGLHAGQVAVTISTEICDDTYYGCVNWATNRFEVSVPDDCCIFGSHPNCPCTACEPGSGGPGIQPKYIELDFTGIVSRECYIGEEPPFYPFDPWYAYLPYDDLKAYLNANTFTLEKNSNCGWQAIEVVDLKSQRIWIEGECHVGVEGDDRTIDRVKFNVGLVGGNINITIQTRFIDLSYQYEWKHNGEHSIGSYCIQASSYSGTWDVEPNSRRLLDPDSGSVVISISYTNENLCTE